MAANSSRSEAAAASLAAWIDSIGSPARTAAPGGNTSDKPTRHAASGLRTGASSRLTLSPTPPVECLSTNGAASPASRQSGMPPERVIARVGAVVVARHAAPDDRHRERSDPAFAPAAIDHAGDEVVDLCLRKPPAVALGADDFGREHVNTARRPRAPARCRAPPRCRRAARSRPGAGVAARAPLRPESRARDRGTPPRRSAAGSRPRP